MDDEKITKFLFSKPKEAFEFFEKGGVDFKQLKELDLGRLLVKQRYQLTQEQIEAVEFVYWLSYFEEREFGHIISEVEKSKGATTPMIQAMLDKLHFGDKISLIEQHYASQSKDKDFIKLAWKVNKLRNEVAHGRFDDLNYDGFHLSDPKGQLKIIIDLMNAALHR
jgi:hypothetical protein